MKRWLVAMLAAALLAGMVCGVSVAEEEGATENTAPSAPQEEAQPAPEPVNEAPKAEHVEEAPKAEPIPETPKEETHAEVRETPKAEVKQETKVEDKAEAKQETKAETKTEAKQESKVETKQESKQETKVETRTETKVETRVEVRAETKAESKSEAETQNGPTGDVKADAPSAAGAAAVGSVSVNSEGNDPSSGPDNTEPATNATPDPESTDTPEPATNATPDPNSTKAPEPSPGSDTTPGSETPTPTSGSETSEPTASPDPDETNAPEETPAPTDGTEEVSAETRQIQTWLAALGYLSESRITGVYDDETRDAVRRFQADNGLTATGECDGATRSLLERKATGDGAAQPTEAPDAPSDTGVAPESDGGPAPDGTPEGDAAPGPDGLPGDAENPEGAAPDSRMLPGRGGFGGFGRGFGRRGGFGGSAGRSGLGGAEDEPQDDALNGVTPGEALTSTHASGDRDDTPYGALDVETELFALGIECADNPDYAYAVDGGALTLSGGDRWAFDGAALRTLSISGVNRLILSGSRTVAMDTAPQFTGAAYAALRARGYTDNTFEYSVDMTGEGTKITVSAGGESYLLGADGALIPNESDGGK